MLGAIVILVLIISGCVFYSQQTPKRDTRLEFVSSECQGPIDNYEEGVKETRWIDDNNLEVTAYVIINCCNEIRNGDYEILDNKIILKYENVGEDLCDCICGHNLIYTFHNIDKKDYQFKFNGKYYSLNGVHLPAYQVETGWKTYTNNNYGFEVKYPSHLEIIDGSSRNDWVFDFCAPDFTTSDKECKPVVTFSLSDNKDSGIGVYIIQKNMAFQIIKQNSGANYAQEKYENYADENYLYYMQFSSNVAHSGYDLILLDEIKSTFKFIK
jgi:hypothetical protein